ncbi:histidine phosphatase family protein [Vreelandella arcis]|uniref:Histidine phosphatase superfamily (Branch 1) n=1 Tax=Vreelandella arcis TaxID=416873 RepID=A0A1H0F2Y1_9GAMM|nr:histidine phosphatase family protein [Halomonas arcis]SDN89028.1 Histidine phosphatase superfamily (branch 1) [Halomonas arcis]
MEIFLLRHAETKANRDGALATGSGDTLTPHGRSQAQSIIEGLMEFEVEAILSSPYPRALETIRPFAQAAKLEVDVHPCLAEGQLVLGESPVQEELKYFRHTSGYDYPSEHEAAGAFLSRVVEAHKLIVSQPFARVLVVTHGHMLRELLNNILSMPNKTRFPHENCGLTHVSVGEVNMVNYVNRPMCSN